MTGTEQAYRKQVFLNVWYRYSIDCLPIFLVLIFLEPHHRSVSSLNSEMRWLLFTTDTNFLVTFYFEETIGLPSLEVAFDFSHVSKKDKAPGTRHLTLSTIHF